MNKLCIQLACAFSVLACLLVAETAVADDVPGNTIRIGLYSVFFHARADDISGPYTPEGLNIHIENTETLYFAYVRRLSADFDVELAMGAPPKTKTEGQGPATVGSVPYNGQVISTARWISPTLLINYKFLDESSAFRPYIGVGVNYTTFWERDSTAAGDAVTGGPTRVSLTSSVGPAGTVGVSYRFIPHLSGFLSYSISQVKTHLTADTDGIDRVTSVSFRPQALILAVGYSF